MILNSKDLPFTVPPGYTLLIEQICANDIHVQLIKKDEQEINKQLSESVSIFVSTLKEYLAGSRDFILKRYVENWGNEFEHIKRLQGKDYEKN